MEFLILSIKKPYPREKHSGMKDKKLDVLVIPEGLIGDLVFIEYSNNLCSSTSLKWDFLRYKFTLSERGISIMPDDKKSDTPILDELCSR